MQFSENWLRTMANPDLDSAQLSHLLTMAGLEVEEVAPVAPPFSHVVVAKVLSMQRHPNADRLNVCQVDAGTGSPLTIVCGAPNVHADMMVACALPGAVLPPGADGKPFEIKVGLLRGIESQGMLCSARELKLSDDHGGLLELPADATIGADFRDYYQLDDRTFTIKLTPNKADCLSVLGVAREVAALTGVPLASPVCPPVAVTIPDVLPVRISAPDLCGRFSGRIIRGVDARAPTPQWMKQRLERSGQRAISALVDISNYVMLELGRPTHVFDLAKIHGGLDVRWGRAGESLKLLNGSTVAVDDWIGVIADEQAIESLAGIMGGDATAVTLETTDIYLEAAFWHPQAIQGRVRRLNFSTDAAHRFERGVDYATTVEHLERITALIVEICGGGNGSSSASDGSRSSASTSSAHGGTIGVGPIDDQIVNLPVRKPVKMRTARAVRVIGVPLDDALVGQIFTRLGLVHTVEEGVFTVTPPSFRFDLDIEEDLIEEVARVYGFEKIPALPPVAPNAMRIRREDSRSLFAVTRLLASLDYQEVVNYSFVEAGWEADFAGNAKPIAVVNPIASQMSVMRSNLVGSLIANLRYNLNRKLARIRVFELGTVYHRDETVADGPLSVAGYRQPKRIAALAYGGVVEEQWGQPARAVDFFDVKADLEALFAPLSVRFEALVHPALHPGRAASVLLDGAVVGFIGELHPRWQQKYELPGAPVIFEVDALALQHRTLPVSREISKFPVVVRDLALVVGQAVSVQNLLDVFSVEVNGNAACRILQAIVLFDEYRGKGLQGDEKSLAFRFTLQDTQSTLQDEAVDAAITAFVAAAKNKYNARLRA